jgi:hypothetical protein
MRRRDVLCKVFTENVLIYVVVLFEVDISLWRKHYVENWFDVFIFFLIACFQDAVLFLMLVMGKDEMKNN